MPEKGYLIFPFTLPSFPQLFLKSTFGCLPTIFYLCKTERTNKLQPAPFIYVPISPLKKTYIMIQRIQSIYLFLTTALMAVFLFLPIAQFDTTDGIYSFTAQGISTVEAMTTPVQDSAAAVTQTSVFTPTWGVFVLGTVIAVLSFITIFLYKNRPTQARICMINAFFLVTFYIVIFLSGYTFREDLSASNISWTAYIVMPFVALILDILAYKAINKDERLVRSLDRIR